MGTRSAIAEPHGDAWRGRYAHWDGYPTSMGAHLWKIVQRDGVEVARKRLIHDRYGWSSINAAQPDITGVVVPEGAAMLDYEYGTPEYVVLASRGSRFGNEPGYGEAYTTEQDQSHPDDWIWPNDQDTWCEWAYILADDGLWVLKLPGDHLLGIYRWDEPEPDWGKVEEKGWPRDEG